MARGKSKMVGMKWGINLGLCDSVLKLSREMLASIHSFLNQLLVD